MLAIDMVRKAMFTKIEKFVKQGIRELCPVLSVSSVEGALRKLVKAKDIHYSKVGARRVPCKEAWVTKEIYDEMMKMQWAEAKAEERAGRCLISNGKGGFIMCPECNKCCNCTKVGSVDFDNNHITSLDALMEESEAELTSVHVDFGSSLETLDMMEILVDELSKINPEYGEIFRVMLNGTLRPSHISKETGIPNSTVAKYVPIIQALAQELYFEYTNK